MVACSLAASADAVPSYATASPESISGTIAAITGKYTLSLDDQRGFTDSVTLHDGTIIEPSGVSLEVSQQVTILGHTDGKTFDADEIDTDGAEPYDSSPAAAYYSGPYDAGAYAPYIVPLGNGAFYYGSAFGLGGNGGFYFQNPGSSSSQGPVTIRSGPATTPVNPHGPPIAHPPVTRIRIPVDPPSRTGSFGASGGVHAPPSHPSNPAPSRH